MSSLSNSTLWRSMHDYYNHLGPEAWADEIVPFQITNNLSLAKLYTNLIIAQINDYLTKYGNTALNEPFYILEIGAGSGKFSFYLLKTLCAALKIYNLPETTILYVMTDISEQNIKSWQQHPNLLPYAKKGIVEFTYFNAVTDDNICLSKKIIKPNSLAKPLFVIGNYIIDTLPHDAFQIINGKLHEVEVEIKVKNNNNLTLNNIKQYFNNVTYKFKQNPITNKYYEQQLLAQILKDYQQHFVDNASFLLPIGGMQLLDKIANFTKSHAVLLTADKGTAALELFTGLDDPDISLHGSVSMMVNFDALARYVNMQAGTSLLMTNKSAEFQIACFVVNKSFAIPHTTFAFNSISSTFNLFDLFTLCYKNDSINESFTTIDELLAVFNLANWDPSVFYDYHHILLEFLENQEITEEQRLTLIFGVEQVWEYFFKLEKTQDIPFAIGIILYNIDEIEKALIFYQHSRALFGEQEETLYNIALAYQQLEDQDNMQDFLKKILTLNPNYQPAHELLAEC